MRFTSTRNRTISVGFEQVIRNCIPEDGGLYIPADMSDLRRWILYSDEQTSYASVAGAMTLACINEEFSPIICETIATHAFPYEPVLKKLDDGLFLLELYHGPTGWQRDFCVNFLIESLETILEFKGNTAITLDYTSSAFGSILSHALRDKKYIKSVLLFPKDAVKGLQERDYIWNGGTVYPIEIDGTEEDCRNLIRAIFKNKTIVSKCNLTTANSANVGRLIAQMFVYPFAFSRLKKQVSGTIYYAMDPGSYSNLVAGLYAWRLAMPVNGFIVPATGSLTLDSMGNCTMLDSLVPLNQREPVDPAFPNNIERLEEVFSINTGMMKNLVFPQHVTDEDTISAVKELFMKYGQYADKSTAQAYAAAKKMREKGNCEGGTIVLLAKNDPALSGEFIRHCLGEAPTMADNVAAGIAPTNLNRPLVRTPDDIISVLSSLTF